MSTISIARLVYRLLADRAEGMSRDALRDALGVNDREMREAVELCAKMAARPQFSNAEPQVVGFDPQIQRYVMASSPQQADRIIEFTEAYVRSTLERLEAYREARERRWGETANVEQPDLFRSTLE